MIRASVGATPQRAVGLKPAERSGPALFRGVRRPSSAAESAALMPRDPSLRQKRSANLSPIGCEKNHQLLARSRSPARRWGGGCARSSVLSMPAGRPNSRVASKRSTGWRERGGLCCRRPGAVGALPRRSVSTSRWRRPRGCRVRWKPSRGCRWCGSRNARSACCGIPCCTSSIRGARRHLPVARCAIWLFRRTGCSARSGFRLRRCICGRARRGWGGSDGQRQAHLHRVLCLSRFLIRPGVQCRNLASSVLGRVLHRLPADFEARYRYRRGWSRPLSALRTTEPASRRPTSCGSATLPGAGARTGPIRG